MYPKFKFLGHACVLIELESLSIITDPWFKRSIHHNTFYQVPEVIKPTQEEISKIKFIHLSHIHRDHFCAESLQVFDKNSVEVIICDFENKHFLEKIYSLGFKKVHQVRPWGDAYNFQLFNMKTYSPEKFDGSFDSSFAIELNNLWFYFSNDCLLSNEQYEKMFLSGDRFQGAFLASDGISPFPTCFEVKIEGKEDWRKNKIEKKHQFYRNHFENFCNLFKCVWACPYGVGLRFLHPEIKHLNDVFQNSNSFNFELLHTRVLNLAYGTQVDTLGKTIESTNSTQNELSKSHNTPTEENFDLDVLDKNIIENYLLHLLQEYSAKWTHKMVLEFKIFYLDQYFLIKIEISNKMASKSESDPDMVIEMNARFVYMLINQIMTFKEFLYTYRFKVKIYKHVPGQMNLLTWSS